MNLKCIAQTNSDSIASLRAHLLDSSLITQTNKKIYNAKIIICGDYIQAYYHNEMRIKKDNDCLIPYQSNSITNSYQFYESKKITNHGGLNTIEYKNLLRSKLAIQRIAKCNEKNFKSCTTLTFEDNVISLDIANNILNNWLTCIRKVKKDFMYLGVPEFQKRGAVHYHIMTNIDYNDCSLLNKEERKIWNKNKGWQIGKDIKFWKHGNNMTKEIHGLNVVNYISNYITSDYDNRLFGRRRYFHSNNLLMPRETFLDLTNDKHAVFFFDLMKFHSCIYSNIYKDIYTNRDIEFKEYKIQQLS